MRPIYNTQASNIAVSTSGYQKWSNSSPSATQSLFEVTSNRSRSTNSPISKSIDETINKLLNKASSNSNCEERSAHVNRRTSLQLQQQQQQQEQTDNAKKIKHSGSPHQRSSSLISRNVSSPPLFTTKPANSSMSPTQLIGMSSPPFLPHTPITPCNAGNPFYCSSSSNSPLMGNGVGGPGSGHMYKMLNEFASPFCSSPNVDSTNTSLFSSQLRRYGQHQMQQQDQQSSVLNEKCHSTDFANPTNRKVADSSSVTTHQHVNITDYKNIMTTKTSISLNGTIALIGNLQQQQQQEQKKE
jgi:hypothetical protein